jgi:hypothetical protein
MKEAFDIALAFESAEPAENPTPNQVAARERDRAARAAVSTGSTLATKRDALELRAWRGRGGWRA